GCPCRTPSASSASSPPPCTTPTPPASSTATSSRPTSCSTGPATPTWPTSAWPSWATTRASGPRRAPCWARRCTCRRSRPAGDQYSLGVLFYELLCGRVPFRGPVVQVLHQALTQPPPAPRSFDPAVPPELEAVCLRALAKRPQERFPDCRALAEALDAWSS